MAAIGQLYFFCGRKKFKIIQILLSHSSRYGDVQVFFRVLLKFKMAAMDKLIFVGSNDQFSYKFNNG